MKKDCPCIVFEGKEVYYNAASEVGALFEVIMPIVIPDKLSLKGVYQQENLALALAVIEKVFPEISDRTIEQGLKNVKHPCRFQYIEDKNLIIDGAHNPNGINSLIESLDNYYPKTKRRFIFGCLRNKDYTQMLDSICNSISMSGNDYELYFYHFSHENSATYEQLQDVCSIDAKELSSETEINFNDGYLNIICGSFYMIAELAKMFKIEVI